MKLNESHSSIVYAIDDDRLLLQALEKHLVEAEFSVRTFQSPTDFLNEVEDLEAGVVITDQQMPEIKGLEVIRAIRIYGGRFPAILLSGFPETRVAVAAMKMGTVTVLDKPYHPEQLLKSVQEGFELLEKLGRFNGMPPILPDGQKYADRLSGREAEVIGFVYEGSTNKAISIQLDISIKTVEKHRGRAMKKMEVTSVAQLVRLMDRERQS